MIVFKTLEIIITFFIWKRGEASFTRQEYQRVSQFEIFKMFNPLIINKGRYYFIHWI